jgi:hypothetical protein
MKNTMKKKYFEITVELKTGKAIFLIVCEQGETITETLVWYIVYNNISTDIEKRINYQHREINIFDYIKSPNLKFKTSRVTFFDESVACHLSDLLQRPLSLYDKVLPSAL